MPMYEIEGEDLVEWTISSMKAIRELARATHNVAEACELIGLAIEGKIEMAQGESDDYRRHLAVLNENAGRLRILAGDHAG